MAFDARPNQCYIAPSAQRSSSFGRGWQNCSKKIRRLFNWYITTYGKMIKGHVCLYAYFSLFGLETHFITKFPYFWAFFGLLKVIWGGYSYFKNVEKHFSAQNIAKSFQKTQIYFNLFGWPRGFCHPLRPLCTGHPNYIRGTSKGHPRDILGTS